MTCRGFFLQKRQNILSLSPLSITISMKQEIDINKWNRKETFELFKNYADPYCGVTVNMDFTHVYNAAKRNGASFYLYYLHVIMQAVNNYGPIRLRIINGKVYLYDRIGVSPTVGREDGTFCFCYYPYYEDREQFVAECQRITQEVKSQPITHEELTEEVRSSIFFSAIPWIQYTSVKNPLNLDPNDSNPRISTGRLFDQDGRKIMPFSVLVHHSLMDGFHIAQFLQKIEELNKNY